MHLPRLALILIGALLCTASPLNAGDEEERSFEQIKAIFETETDRRKREDAARKIAEYFYDPVALVPWLEGRIEKEKDFHVWIALAYALAAQGEKRGLQCLVNALKQTGHLGYVYLRRISQKDFAEPGNMWNRPAWVEWLKGLDEEEWRDLVRRRKLPRGPNDADTAGLARAITWWDGLGFPDITALPSVRVYTRDVTEEGDTLEWYHYGFLLEEGEGRFKVFQTDLAEVEYEIGPVAPGSTRSHRFEKTDLVADVKRDLQPLPGRGAAPDDPMEYRPDAFGVSGRLHVERFKGFVLAAALQKRGSEELAQRVWQRIGENGQGGPEHGKWSVFDLLKEDVRRHTHEQWDAAVVDSHRTWRESLDAYRVVRARLGHGEGAPKSETEAILTRMAAEEQRYAIVNTWRKANGQDPLGLPAGPRVEPLPADRVLPLVTTWLEADPGKEREGAEDALIELGLGTLSVLQARRAAEGHGAWKRRLDGLVRRVAAIVREIRWAQKGPRPNAALRALVEALRGKPVRGRDLTNLFRQCALHPTPGATGIDLTLSRTGDDTGYVLSFGMTIHRVPWRGGKGGFILSGDGQRGLVDDFLEDRDSWWHVSRASQLDRILLQPADQEVHLRRSFVEVK